MYLGLTGGIASGKNTVAKMFSSLGAYTIDADEISREVMSSGHKTYDKIVENFGRDILKENNEIDRKALRKIVFDNAEKRQLLESIVHPAILEEEKKRVGEIKGRDDKAIIITHAALIIEKGTFERFDGVIVVYAEREQQITRLIKRDSISREYAEKIISSQMPLDEKVKYADFIIDNTGTPEDTKQDVLRVFNAIKIYKYCFRQLRKKTSK
ncbi:dephospho-CoA kinase [Flexistipes sp.]|uniref:dephospho-CoA kinase n=1 Tax=Flexistipes sp. TaxID=3088135 RepID=UPI002E241350|nr:dephospho-CoA kinase [Flexistipes sp.]MEC9491769.1 dephospho-CoA kinase [Flexistipes sp.]